jgi:hypothetical protein
MPVNYEVKGGVARILATENLIVEHRKCHTAQFNVQTRVLTLPMWDRASEEVFDLLVAHEVGHALYTPDVNWIVDRKIPPGYVNVVEDARIEKLMKRRYPGLPKTFYRGYSQMHEDDFFELKDDKINTFSLIDRINLYFKIGNFLDLDFDSAEQRFVDMIEDAETFDEVLNISEEIYNYSKKEKEATKENVPAQVDPTQESGGAGDFYEPQSFQESGDSEEGKPQDGGEDSTEDSGALNPDFESSSGNQPQGVNDSTDSSPGKGDDEKSITDEILNRKLSSLINDNAQHDNLYLEFPEFKIESFVASNNEVHQYLSGEFAAQEKNCPVYINGNSIFYDADRTYQEYKSSCMKEVNYLVKEFECKKAADSYSRASVSKTGVLDCNKLHTYKLTDDIFKKVTTIPDGKNHGLIFILDWSGSMGNTIVPTLKQLYNLINFCKKCSIPFDVYAFTQNWKTAPMDVNPYARKNGTMKMDIEFSLMNLLTSSVSNRELEKQMKNIWRVVYAIKNWTPYAYPVRLGLSGTPLNETMMCLRKIIPQFQNKNKIQKVHCIVLTDGEGNPLNYDKEVISRNNPNETHLASGSVFYCNGNVFLRNRVTGKVHKFLKNAPYSHQDIILQSIKDEFPSVNFIAFRIVESGHDVSKLLDQYVPSSESDKKYKVLDIWKKFKTFSIDSTPYDKYFGLGNSQLNNTVDHLEQLEDGATKMQIRNAMRKTLSTKKMNKKILSEFIELVA